MENKTTVAQFFMINRKKNIGRISEWERLVKEGLLTRGTVLSFLESMACCGVISTDLRVNEKRFKEWEVQVYEPTFS